MNKSESAKLIQQHRWFLSKETDYAVARRAEHAYTNIAELMLITGVFWIDGSGSLIFRIVPGIALFAFAGFCYWRRQRFISIREQFENQWPQNFSDLDARTRDRANHDPN